MSTLPRRAALLALPLLALAPMACDDDPAGPTDTITFETSSVLAGRTMSAASPR